MAINEGIGCKKCPVEDCAGSYRGSWCAAERAKFGLGDPLTNFERIKAMGVEEMARWLVKKTKHQESAWSEPSYLNFLTELDDTMNSAINGTLAWLEREVQE